MKSLSTHIILILSISLFCLLINTYSHEFLAYSNAQILKGEVWRLVTAHLTHTNHYHFLFNALGMIVVIKLFIATFKKQSLMLAFLFCSVQISLSLFLLNPSIEWYMGLSGVLHSFFAIGVCDELKQRSKWGVILGVGIIAKLGIEQINSPSLVTEALINSPVLIEAHLYGAVAGVTYYLFREYLIKKR